MFGRSRPPLRDLEPRRVGLIKPSALGDIVHSLPVLTALRRRFPSAHITWVVNRAYEPILEGHPHLDATLPFDRSAARGGLWTGFRAFIGFLGALRRQRFDLVIDLQGLLRTGLMTRATGARRRVGLATARERATWFYTDRVPVPDFQATHAVDRYWLVAAALGAGGPREFHVPLQPDARAWADGVLRALARPWVAVAPGSRWLTKRWPPGHFAELARRGQARFGGTVILVGTPDEAPLAAAVRQQLAGPVLDLTGKTSLAQLAALLARVDVMAANDTGPLHLAAALGRPVVAPYTCTKIARTGPYGSNGLAVESRVWCQGSYLKRCPRMECMTELTPDRLWPLLCEVLQSWESRSRSA
jgi:lipopolysaccharide heptosyltransferase I